jgi:hypothetical protein
MELAHRHRRRLDPVGDPHLFHREFPVRGPEQHRRDDARPGLCQRPRLLGIFGVIPCLGWIAVLIGAILSFVAGFIAVRESMEFDSGKAILTVIISWVISFAITFAVGLLTGGAMAATGALGG